jgi:hypothetical protein
MEQMYDVRKRKKCVPSCVYLVQNLQQIMIDLELLFMLNNAVSSGGSHNIERKIRK